MFPKPSIHGLLLVGLLILGFELLTAAALQMNNTQQANKTKGIIVYCSSRMIRVHVFRSYYPDVDPQQVSFKRSNDSSCNAGFVNDSLIVLRAALSHCGTTHSEKGSAIIYSNAVILKIGGNVSTITRQYNLEVSFRCAFLRTGVFVTFGFQPNDKIEVVPDAASPDGTVAGNFSFDFAMFQDENYTEPFKEEEFPVQVELGQRLFFEVSLSTNDSHLALFLDNCRATPTSNPFSAHRFTFLEDGCAREESVQQVNHESLKKRFSIKAFRFTADFKEVYMHCELQVCHSTEPHTRCAMGCLRQRREVTTRDRTEIGGMATVSVGPIIIMRKDETEEDSTVQTVPDLTGSTQFLVITIAAVLALLIICGTIIIACYLGARSADEEEEQTDNAPPNIRSPGFGSSKA